MDAWIKELYISMCPHVSFLYNTLSVKLTGRIGTNDIKGLTDHLHNIFSIFKLQSEG